MMIEKDFTFRQTENIKKIIHVELNHFKQYNALNEHIQKIEDLIIKINILEQKVYKLETKKYKNIFKRLFHKFGMT